MLFHVVGYGAHMRQENEGGLLHGYYLPPEPIEEHLRPFLNAGPPPAPSHLSLLPLPSSTQAHQLWVCSYNGPVPLPTSVPLHMLVLLPGVSFLQKMLTHPESSAKYALPGEVSTQSPWGG